MEQRHQDFGDALGFWQKNLRNLRCSIKLIEQRLCRQSSHHQLQQHQVQASKLTRRMRGRDSTIHREKDGRYMKSFNGINICYDWARNKDGCENTACQNTWHTCGNGVANPIGQWIAHKFQDGSLEINQTREKDVEKAGEGTGQGVADVR